MKKLEMHASGLQPLSFNELDEVNGGAFPVLVLAAGATAVKFSFVRGVFAGIREKETAEPRG